MATDSPPVEVRIARFRRRAEAGVRGWLLSIAFGIVLLSSAWAQPRPEDPRVTVGIALDAPVPLSAYLLRTMINETDIIWKPLGVSVILAASSEPLPTAVCLTLRFEPGRDRRATARSVASKGRIPLGGISFDETGAPEQVIRVDLEAVIDTLREAAGEGGQIASSPPDLVTARALGRVLAHELGHYLLAWPAHTATGLMRSAFSGRDLARWDRQSFALDRRLLPRLRPLLARSTPE